MIQKFDPAQAKVNWDWVTLSGRDAEDFLHRLTTVHVRALGIGQGSAGCFLSAQGKVRAHFALWHYADQDYAFELEGGREQAWKKELLAAIDQYTFAEKITLADVTDLGCLWFFADSEIEAQNLLSSIGVPDLGQMKTQAIAGEIRLCHQGANQYGRPWITAWGQPVKLAQWAESALGSATAVNEATLESWRIASLRPRVDAEITSASIPLEAGLIDAIAQGKGCYPGQEVIERIVSLGSPARRLVQIQGTGPAPKSGETILNTAEPAAEVGQITSVTASADNAGPFTALAFVRKLHAKEGLEVRWSGSSSPARITKVAPYSAT